MSSFNEYGIRIDSKQSYQQKTICPKCSHSRHKTYDKCLSVNTDKGVWFCWHCGYSGSINEKQYAKTNINAIETKHTSLGNEIIEYLNNRGISAHTLFKFKVTQDDYYFKQAKAEHIAICFNYYYGNKLVNVKYRSTKDKYFAQTPNRQPILYNINSVIFEDECIITEGEIDALSFAEAGFPNVVSVPDGAPNFNATNIENKMAFIDNSFDILRHIKKFYIAADNDPNGNKLKKELARRLGKTKCYVVEYPNGCKDANDTLNKYGALALAHCIENAAPYPISGVYQAADKIDEFNELYENGFNINVSSSWEQVDRLFKPLPGMLTVVTGVPSHGKTNFIANYLTNLSKCSGWQHAVFSPEDATIAINMSRLAEIYIGKPFLPGDDQMFNEEKEQAFNFINNHFYYIEPDNEEYTLNNILDAATNIVMRYGVNSLLIDPWNVIEHQIGNTSETVYINKTLVKLKFFARMQGIHIFLVAHPRKMNRIENDSKKRYIVPTPYDISGSAHWYNCPDNCMTVYRNMENNTSFLYVQKVKHKFIGRLGYSKFSFDTSCQRYTEIG